MPSDATVPRRLPTSTHPVPQHRAFPSLQFAPSTERVCRGERSTVVSHCCLGCLQVSKLKQLQVAAMEVAVSNGGLTALSAARIASDSIAAAAGPTVYTAGGPSVRSAWRSGPTSAAMGTLSGTGTTPLLRRRGVSSLPQQRGDDGSTRGSSEAPPSPLLSDFSGPSALSTSASSSATGGKEGVYPTPRPASSAAFSAMSTGGPLNEHATSAVTPARPSAKSNSGSGLTASIKSFFMPRSRNSAGRGTVQLAAAAAAVAADVSPQAPSAQDSAALSNAVGLAGTSPRLPPPELASGVACVTPMPPARGARTSDAHDGSENSFVEDAARLNLNSSRAPSTAPHAAADAAGDTRARLFDDGAPQAEAGTHRRSRYFPGAVVSPTVLMDCDCGYPHDDGTGWYKGRAGTSAYWCPQVS